MVAALRMFSIAELSDRAAIEFARVGDTIREPTDAETERREVARRRNGLRLRASIEENDAAFEPWGKRAKEVDLPARRFVRE